MKKWIFVTLISLVCLAFSQVSSDEKYLVFFKDKPLSFLKNEGSLDHWMTTHLSAKVLERRQRRTRNAIWDERDIPIFEPYIQSIQKLHVQIIHRLRWFNAVSVKIKDKTVLNRIINLPFVREVRPVKSFIFRRKNHFPTLNQLRATKTEQNLLQNVIKFIKADSLKKAGLNGQGVTIGVFDTGFEISNPLFEKIRSHLVAKYDFVDGDTIVEDTNLEEFHGTFTASIIGGYYQDSTLYYEGFAPEAHYILCRTEYVAQETHLEEDNWAAAAQFAESLGVDIISTSLGYSVFDPGEGDYTYADMDGKSTLITQAANVLTEKGVVVVVAAGNEGNNTWHYITAPADGFDVISVGAIGLDSVMAPFSSYGPTYDGRVKPEIVAPGVSIPGANANSTYPIDYLSGTSAACPVAAGGLALILQAFPNITINQLRNVMIDTANPWQIKGANKVPGDQYGYGVIQINKIYNQLKKVDSIQSNITLFNDVTILPNPYKVGTPLIISVKNSVQLPLEVEIYNILGQQIDSFTLYYSANEILPISFYANGSGLYIIRLKNGRKIFLKKLMVVK